MIRKIMLLILFSYKMASGKILLIKLGNQFEIEGIAKERKASY